ncbi:MAG: sulfite oxidase-like oxidoreductase [Anaerolineae bacterium]|nr:sulfite oxidase-like oxidoreductase [Anaerolineae bacterium]
MQDERRKLEARMRQENRLPPGQSATFKFPVLHYGPVPEVDLETWTFRTLGLVDEEKNWTWKEFLELPTTSVTCDVHCVTTWSKFGTNWEGVSFKSLVELAGVKPEAQYVLVHAEYGYTANLPLDVMLDDDVLLAYKYEGEYLEPDHGFPLRTLVPSRYFWKSVKWVRAVEFLDADKPGFWEKAGYHNEADPWKEQRHVRRTGW